MPTMKSESQSSRPGHRPGFSLFEMMIAMSLGLIVVGMVVYAYGGAHRSQAAAVSGVLLKQASQATINDLYRQLNRTRRIYDRGALADSLLARIPVQGFSATGTPLSPGVPSPLVDQVILPQITVDGSFVEELDNNDGTPGGNAGSPNPDFTKAAVGNALLYLTKESRVVVQDNVAGIQATAFGQGQFYLDAYRLHLIYLARRQLPVGAPPVRGADPYVYQLMHWDSLPYLDRRKVQQWMQGIIKGNNNSGAAQTFITGKLATLGGATGYPGAFDIGAPTAASALFNLATTDYRALTPKGGTPNFVSGHFRTAIRSTMKTSFGEMFVAFNTMANTAGTPINLPVPVMNLAYDVPAYADGRTSPRPYGFEVMVAGQPSARRVLLRLVLCTRTLPAKQKIAEAFQQVTQVSEY